MTCASIANFLFHCNVAIPIAMEITLQWKHKNCLQGRVAQKIEQVGMRRWVGEVGKEGGGMTNRSHSPNSRCMCGRILKFEFGTPPERWPSKRDMFCAMEMPRRAAFP